MRVLVSGAGIAGLTLAYWLHEAGHGCTIVEKAPDIRTEGYLIDFGGSGWDVANRMGIIPQLEARKIPTSAINFLRPNGSMASQLDVQRLYEIAGVAEKFMALNRRDVVDVLYEHVRAYTRICFDMTISQIDSSSEKAHVTFSDGTSADYDLVVGADGIHSHVRNMILGREQQFTKYLGYHFMIFVIPPLNDTLADGYNMYLEPNIQVSINKLDDGQWIVFVTLQDDNPNVPSKSQRNQYVRERLNHMGWICPTLADAIHDDTYIFYDTVTQIINPTWSKERVVLIGDASHCPTLVSGQGASMAMAGAYILSNALNDNHNIEDALKAYDAQLRPHIDNIQQKAQAFAPNFVPDSQWKIIFIHWLMKFSNAPFVKSFIGKQFAIKSIFASE